MFATLESAPQMMCENATNEATPATLGSEQAEVPRREVRFEHSPDLADLLNHLNASVSISTYQAGKLALLGSHEHKLTL